MATETKNAGDKTFDPHSTHGTKDVKKPVERVVTAPVGKTERERLLHERAERPVIAVEAHLAHNIDDPIPELDPNRPKPTPQEVEREKKQKELLAKIGKIMEEYDNRESSIPANHEYWQLVAQLRAL